jgi:hypothetical protein
MGKRRNHPNTALASAGLVSTGSARVPRSTRRLWLFRTLAVSFPFVILLLIEIAFRIVPALDDQRDPFINISPIAVFSRTTSNGQQYYNITSQHVLGGSAVHILVKKPPGTIRIFCVGSSACAGWPHPATERFSAYLQQALETAYPGEKVEVVNCAAHGFAAYRTRHVLDEVLQMQPDAVLVWEGNNEFLEERNYDPTIKIVGELARHLRTVQWLQTKVMRSRTEMSGEDFNGIAQTFWKKAHQQSLRLRQDPTQFAQVQEHFQESFRHMVNQSQRARVPLILCTVPVNMRDWLPTVSCHHLAGEQLEQWRTLYDRAQRCLLLGKYADGVTAIQQAIALESEHAESYFWLGRLLEASGQKAAAWDAFSKARDLDYNPFRAISHFNEIIRLLAKQNNGKGVYLLDLEKLFTNASKYAAPGFDLFLDYVHPTKPANLLVAKNIFDLLIGRVLKNQPADARFSYSDLPVPPAKEPYRDESDIGMQIGEITLSAENRQYETIVNQSETVVREVAGRPPLGPEDPVLARFTPEFAERYRVMRNYVDVRRRIILGTSSNSQELVEANRLVEQFYNKWYPLGRY